MPSTKVKRTLKRAKGFYGRAKNCFRIALPKVERAMGNAFISRKIEKRVARRTWIQQINAATRLNGVSYSTFINQMNHQNIELNRKVLADLAQTEPLSFQAVLAHSAHSTDISKHSESVLQHSATHGLIATTASISPHITIPQNKQDDNNEDPNMMRNIYSGAFDEATQPQSSDDYYT